jgi:predicted metal-dependent hydrolase
MSAQLTLELRDVGAWRLVERVSAKARCIRVEIRGPDEVWLVIPKRASRSAAHAFLRSRERWIARKLAQQRLRRTQPSPPLRLAGADAKTLKGHARREATAMIANEAARMGVTANGLRLADQKTLWGSCGASGRISLSWRLVLAPPEVLRYVVIHELAHLKQRNHSPRFWEIVRRQMPDFEAARRWLREHGAALHAALT